MRFPKGSCKELRFFGICKQGTDDTNNCKDHNTWGSDLMQQKWVEPHRKVGRNQKSLDSQNVHFIVDFKDAKTCFGEVAIRIWQILKCRESLNKSTWTTFNVQQTVLTISPISKLFNVLWGPSYPQSSRFGCKFRIEIQIYGTKKRTK